MLLTERKSGGRVDGGFVKFLQQQLAAKGLYKGKIDGRTGDATRAAIRALQRSAGLAETGTATTATIKALRDTTAASPPMPRLRPASFVSANKDYTPSPVAPVTSGYRSQDMGDISTDKLLQRINRENVAAKDSYASEQAATKAFRFPDRPISAPAISAGAGVDPHPRDMSNANPDVPPEASLGDRAAVWMTDNTLPGIRRALLSPEQQRLALRQALAAKTAAPVARAGFAHGGSVTTGPLVSSVPGRTDHHPINVPNGAYVLPADIVSAQGQGNTIAGMAKLKNIFAAKLHAFRHRPRPLTLTRSHEHRAAGGGVAGAADAIPIMAAGGEMVVDPETVAAYGGGDLKRGHAAFDAFVKDERAKLIKQLKKLPGPVKD